MNKTYFNPMRVQFTSSQQFRSQQLMTFIVEKMNGAPIPFSAFMEHALYLPDYGYYASNDNLIGADGDFVTAPHLTPLLGETFSSIFIDVFDQCGTSSILEWGAGQGCFAKSILNACRARGIHDVQYYIIEKSPALRARQQLELKNENVKWLLEPPSEFSGVMFANEVADAIPVECFYVSDDRVVQRGVYAENNQLNWVGMPLPTSVFADMEHELNECHRKYNWKNGYASECHPHARAWMKQSASILKKGCFLLLDYGYSEQEYYRRERNRGTLMCFVQHQCHDNPFLFPGLQDISVHVNFSALARAGCEAGLALSGYTTQAMCLLGLGIESCVHDVMQGYTSTQQAELMQTLKTLLMPNQMGDRIRSLFFQKDISVDASGFQIRDLRGDL